VFILQTKNAKHEKRRKEILKAASQAISEQGFNNITLQSIADYAKVSKGVASYYFKNKEDILYHLLKFLTKIIYQNEALAISKEKKALDMLKTYVNAVFAGPSDNREFYRVYLEFLAQANHNENFRAVNQQFYENCWYLGKKIIAAGQQEEVFNDIDLNRGAQAIRACIDGFLIQWLMINDDSKHSEYKNNCYTTLVAFLTNKNVIFLRDVK